jgi:hypothetical protein
MAQGAARKCGVSKHLPALGYVSAHGSVLRGCFATPQNEVVGEAIMTRKWRRKPLESLKTDSEMAGCRFGKELERRSPWRGQTRAGVAERYAAT